VAPARVRENATVGGEEAAADIELHVAYYLTHCNLGGYIFLQFKFPQVLNSLCVGGGAGCVFSVCMYCRCMQQYLTSAQYVRSTQFGTFQARAHCPSIFCTPLHFDGLCRDSGYVLFTALCTASFSAARCTASRKAQIWPPSYLFRNSQPAFCSPRPHVDCKHPYCSDDPSGSYTVCSGA
jgi:hypothetical protein